MCLNIDEAELNARHFPHQMPEKPRVISVPHQYTLLKRASLCKTQTGEER